MIWIMSRHTVLREVWAISHVPQRLDPEMRLTTRTNLAMRALMQCAVTPNRLHRMADVARAINASPNHLAQVIHLLAQQGYLHTVRGRAGGLQLGRPAAQISVGAVFRSFEAGLPLTECLATSGNTCPLTAACRLKCLLSEALTAFYDRLDTVTLADLVVQNADLDRLLSAPDQPRTPATRRRRKALVSTNTDDPAMAAAASIGDSCGPPNGTRTPAATGISAAL